MRIFVSATSGDLKSFRKAVAAQLQRLKQPENPSDWRSLLRLACADEGPSTLRFVNEFAGWEKRNSGSIDRIVQ